MPRRSDRMASKSTTPKTEVKKKTVKFDGEEITASENWFKKIAEEHKMEMARNLVKKEYQCSGCKIFPRPGTKTVKKCSYCSKIFCTNCGIHPCPNNGGKVVTPKTSIT